MSNGGLRLPSRTLWDHVGRNGAAVLDLAADGVRQRGVSEVLFCAARASRGVHANQAARHRHARNLRQDRGNFTTVAGEDQRASAAIYILFNQFVQPDERSAQFAEVYERCSKILSDPSIEALCLHLLFSITPTWPIASQREVLDTYFETRNQKSGLRVPELFEAGMVLSLAERYRGGGDTLQAKALLDFAAVNILHVGPLAMLATDFDPEVAINWRVLLPQASSAGVPEDMPEAGVKASQAGSGPLPAVEVGNEVDQSN